LRIVFVAKSPPFELIPLLKLRRKFAQEHVDVGNVEFVVMLELIYKAMEGNDWSVVV